MSAMLAIVFLLICFAAQAAFSKSKHSAKRK